MIQVTEIQIGKFCMEIYGVDCVFMPIELFVEYQFLPLKKVLKGSTIGWYVARKFISYNQIKKAIKKFAQMKKAL